MSQVSRAQLDENTRVPGPAEVVVQNWGWRYASRNSWALEDVSLTIRAGERVLILGASGSGKSTLLHALAGLVGSPDEGDATGSIALDGVSVQQSRHRVGMVLQDPDSQVMLARVGDDVAFGCENLSLPPEMISRRTADALAAVSLHLPLDHPTNHLSGGQKQRLALAGVLAMKPSLLLLDEPTALLDPAGILEVRDAVAAVSADRAQTVVIVEHRPDIWQDLVDRVVVLGERGSVVADGSPEVIFGQHREQLRARGIWVPDETSRVHGHPRVPGQLRCLADSLAVGWSSNVAVAHIDRLELMAGTITVITGPNGSGKSTLALTLGGLLPAVAGRLEVLTSGHSDEAEPSRWKSRDLATRVASVFQIPEQQFMTSTVRAELGIALRGFQLTDAQTRDRVEHLAEHFGLSHLLDANPFTLSGGEQRRLSVASAVIVQPEILILDEPTFGQDALTWQAVAEQIREVRDAGCAVVIVTHDAKLLDELADVHIRLEPSANESSSDEKTTPEPRATAIQSISPLAKLIAATLISLGLIVTLDWVSALVALVLELSLLAWVGVASRRMIRLLIPLSIAAVLAGFTTALYGRASGDTFVQFGLVHVSAGSLELAGATVLRILAIALPAVMLFATIEPTELADALEQRTTLPWRFVLGALISLRLLDLIGDDWNQLSRASRARGRGDRPRLVRFVTQAFALTVLSLRRADKLSNAIQARGFGGPLPRTWSRTSHFALPEWMLIAIAALITAAALTLSLVSGTFSFVFGAGL